MLRKALIFFSFVLLWTAFPRAFAQTDPQPASIEPFAQLTIFVPGSEGGGVDRTSAAVRRALMSAGLVENVDVVRSPGAGGLIALAQFMRAQDAGPSIFIGGRTLLGAAVYNRSTVSLDDLEPIASLNGAVIAIAVAQESPIGGLGDLAEAVRTNPDLVQWSGGSLGSSDELLIKEIYASLGVGRDGVKYFAAPGGGNPVAENLLENDLTAAVSTVEEFAPFIQSGRIRYIAIASKERIESFDAPTLNEFGLDIALTDWRGVFAAPDIPASQLRKLEALFAALAESDAWARELKSHHWQDIYAPAPRFAGFLQAEKEAALNRARGAMAEPATSSQLARILGRQYRWAIIAALVSLLLLISLVAQRVMSGRQRSVLRENLINAQAEAALAKEEREKALAGATTHINNKFNEWNLTAAENEIGWMLLKGLSFKEIAEARGTSERTVRQQARAIYTKSGLSNRSDLSAFFLEDFFSAEPQTAQPF